MKSILEEL
ncbi:uncharacterized protein FFM5_15350 [Fusarium fujikuroi]|nr:uncharacterized protein FFM5_15350 [Fusarium fujikuroi]